MIPKFRAWDSYYEKMVEVLGIDFEYKVAYVKPKDGDSYEVHFDNLQFLQSTRLKDKNSVEVFKGDIVRCTRGCPHEVVWLEEYGGTFLGGMPAWYLSGLKEGYAWTGEEEMIGNIYENLELLEVESE